MTRVQLNPGLPPPPPEALKLSARLHVLIRNEIQAAGGWISFARFMELALYAPGLGYYSAGSRKLGPAGDFVTAPELSPLFGRALARQLAELVRQELPEIIELGAGSGALAEVVLTELDALDCLPKRYAIVELSADLRERQHSRLTQSIPRLVDHVCWLSALPDHFTGVVVGNEVLDAVPTHRIRSDDDGLVEIGVRAVDDELVCARQPAAGALEAAARALELPADYETELNLAAPALIASLAQRLTRGALLFIDYGFPAHEFYHPQRNRGTLMCHYRHHAHDDPFLWVGLQDITAHVDFSAIARAAGGLDVLGYTGQAQFLINCGITELLTAVPAQDTMRYAPLAAQAQKLLSPAEMGELFKVIALGRGVTSPLLGFCRGDRSHTL